MAFRNFIPQIWAADILKEREHNLVAAKLCNRDYEGEIKDVGDKVKINGVSRPTIKDYDDKEGLGDFERLQDQSTMLEITQSKAFHFYVGDIDAQQAKGNLISETKREAAAAMAEAVDSFIYEEIFKTKAAKLSAVSSLSATNMLSTIMSGLTRLWKNHVPNTETVYLECGPMALAKLILAKVIIETDNMAAIEGGAKYKLKTFNMDVAVTNNLPVESGVGEYMVIRTKKAVSFADQIKEIKAYEPDKYFGDAVKGLQVFGAKVVRPKELAIIPITAFAEETTI